MDVFVPRTKIIPDDHGLNAIVLECACGYALPYPGHPDAVPSIQCERCGTTWRAVEPVRLLDVFGLKVSL